MIRSFSVAFLFPVFCLSILNSAFAQSATSKAARSIYDKNQDALVVVTTISTLSFTTDGAKLPDQQRQTQTLGTIIDSRGIVMLSNSAIDFAVGMKGQRGRAAGEEEFVTVTNARSSFKEIQINMTDGEFFATFLSANEALDLAFLLIDQGQLAKRKEPLPWVDIRNKVKPGELRVADEIVGLSRSSPIYGYIPSVIPGWVTAISKREHTYYITTAGTAQGIPIFDLKGRFAGLTVQRIVEGQRTNLLGTLAASSVNVIADLARARVP